MPSASAGLQIILATVCFAMTGCGGVKDAPSTVTAAGVVTYNGQAVPNASLTFTPESGGEKSRPGSANTDASGKFSAKTSQSAPGLMPGTYKVTVQAYKRNPVDIPPPELAKLGDSNLAVPKKYTDPKTTDAKITVAGGGSPDLAVELKD